jgi:hypothetical protein
MNHLQIGIFTLKTASDGPNLGEQLSWVVITPNVAPNTEITNVNAKLSG